MAENSGEQRSGKDNGGSELGRSKKLGLIRESVYGSGVSPARPGAWRVNWPVEHQPDHRHGVELGRSRHGHYPDLAGTLAAPTELESRGSSSVGRGRQDRLTPSQASDFPKLPRRMERPEPYQG